MNNKSSSFPLSIDTKNWTQLLAVMEESGKKTWIDIFLMFFYQENHESSIDGIAQKYALSIETLNTLLSNISDMVYGHIEKECMWLTPQQKLEMIFEVSKNEVYRLRGTVVAALRIHLIDKLVKVYREPVLLEGLDNKTSDELYKWKILSEYRGKSTKEILDLMIRNRKEMNFLNWRITDSIKKMLKDFPEKTVDCFELLRTTPGGFYNKFMAFVENGTQFLSAKAASSVLKENVASVFLSVCDPSEYVIYRWSLYETISKYLGYKPVKSRPYEGYIKLLKEIAEREESDKELMNKIKEETEIYFWNPLLNGQNIIWQTQNYIKRSYPTSWLQKIYEKGLNENHWVFEDWTKDYTRSVTTFLNMFKEDKTSGDIDGDTKELFLRVKDNSISSNGQGMYSYEEYEKILHHWDEIYKILKRNVESDSISLDDYRQLNALIQPLLSKRKPSAYHRIWAALFPQKLCTIIERGAFNTTYERIRMIDDSLPPLKDTWVESNQVLMDYFKEKVIFKEEYHRPIFAWYLKENLNIQEMENGMNKYIELLKANYNLVLTGAPGTGKTYLARKMAEAMGDPNPGFVQFHPSLDYSDFVEGLRPNMETSSFERVDGIFKKFCKEALSGIKFSDFDKVYDSFVNDLLERPEDNKIIKIKTPKSGAEFGVSINSKLNLKLHTGKTLSPQGVLTRDVMKRTFSGEKVYDYWKGYYEGVIEYLKEQYLLKGSAGKNQSNNRVFIIDEINRGELSKIFGELFYSIDPSYRGEENPVFTQYQNLVPLGDSFDKGFYVPKNVYIIATMNDIDRGVETIDFAIRRRFGWVEITPEDRKDMLMEKIPGYYEDAIKVMENINKTLTGEEIGLPHAYEIGPAYFLKLAKYKGDFHKLWDCHIRGVLYEYLRGDRDIEEKMDILEESFFKPLVN